jgi:hypothetical protein
MNREKIRVLLYPLVVATILYGIWMAAFPIILERYDAYALIDDFVAHWHVGIIFIVLPLLMLLAFKLDHRRLLIVSATILLMLWSMFTVAFLMSPPPNTVWIFAALLTYMTFSLTRRV